MNKLGVVSGPKLWTVSVPELGVVSGPELGTMSGHELGVVLGFSKGQFQCLSWEYCQGVFRDSFIACVGSSVRTLVRESVSA